MICSDEAALKAQLSRGWKTRVDIGDGNSPSVLKANAKW